MISRSEGSDPDLCTLSEVLKRRGGIFKRYIFKNNCFSLSLETPKIPQFTPYFGVLR